MPNFKAEQLYIKLDKKLILEAKAINVTLSNDNLSTTPLIETPKITPILEFVHKNFSKVSIGSLTIGKNIVTFSYTDQPKQSIDNSISFKGNGVDALIFFEMHENYVLSRVEHFIHKPTKIKITGKMVYDFKTELSSSQIKLIFAECAQVDMYIKENANRLAFTAESNTFIDIKPIVNLFGLQASINKWIVDYNFALSYKLIEAKGLYDYNDINLLLDTLFIAAKEKDVSYTFNEELSPVVAKEVDIFFTKGVLDVQPKQAFYNQHPIKGGGVKIDFNGEHVILDVALNVHTQVTQDIIDIVQAYKIPLPIVQTRGETDANININIDLWSEEAYAKAQFFIKEGEILLEGIPYHISNGSIRLNKSFLSIDSGYIRYSDVFAAHVNGSLDLKNIIGDIYFNTEYVNLNLSSSYRLTLLDKTQIRLHYTKEKEQYYFDTTPWKLNEHNITLKEGHVDMSEKFGTNVVLYNTLLHIEGITDANVSGEIDISKDIYSLDVALHHLDMNQSISLSSIKEIPFSIRKDSNITHINFPKESQLLLNSNKLSIKPTRLRIKDDTLDIFRAQFSLDENISAKVSVHYKLGESTAKLSLENTQLLSEDLLFIGPKFNLNYAFKNQTHYFTANDLALNIKIDKQKRVEVLLKDISKIFPYSLPLQTYGLQEGNAKITYKDKKTKVNLIIDNFKPLFSRNGKSITQYEIKGEYKKNTLLMKINDDISIRYTKDVTARIKNIDFNLFPILEYVKETSKQKKKNALNLTIRTEGSNIILDDSGRKVLADKMKIEIKEDTINAKLFYNDGGVIFQSEGDEFTVFGNGLDDRFMNNLFKFSTFEGGVLSFSTYGNFKHHTSLMNIDNTTIKEYTILNNTLAFFNTIPALVTFSVPGYSSSGLKVSNAYALFDINDSIAHVKDSKITSKELVITIEGESNLEESTVDILMQVKTDIGSSAKNIPLVGYIIFGEDTVSTTVHVHGPLANPEVDNAAAKSVVAAPYNILKRTITLPLKWFDDIFSNDKKKEKKR